MKRHLSSIVTVALAFSILPALASFEPLVPVAQAQNSCRTMYSGIATTGFYNTKGNSELKHVSFPAPCANPTVVTQSYTDSVLCSTTGAGPTICPNNPGTTSTDVRASAVNVTSEGFDTFLSSDDPVWVGATSPQFAIAWQATCGDVGVPLCPSQNVISGHTTTGFYNTKANSEFSRVTFPTTCLNPVVVTQSYTDSVLCSTTGAGPTVCPNNPSSTSTDIHSQVGNITSQGFDAFLSSDDPVWVGASSPAFTISYTVTCQNSVPAQTGFAGTTSTVYFNNTGNGNSVFKHVTFPANCPNPSIQTQSYVDSVLCSVGGPGPGICANNPGTTSSDIHSQLGNVTSSGFDIFLTSDDAPWVGAVSPQFPLAWQAICTGASTPTAPQCSDGIDNADAEDTLADANDPGCYTNGVYNPQDNDESNAVVTPTLPQCSDGLDNDNDGKTDFFDAGCYPNNIFNPATYNPNDNDETNAASLCRWARVNSTWVRSCI